MTEAEEQGRPPYRYEQLRHAEFGALDDDGRTVACHVCGRRYRCLPPHVSRMHGMAADEYKEAFGLNKGQGLTSSSYHRGHSATVKRKKLADNLKPYQSTGPGGYNGALTRAVEAARTRRPQAQRAAKARQARISAFMLSPAVKALWSEHMTRVWDLYRQTYGEEPPPDAVSDT